MLVAKESYGEDASVNLLDDPYPHDEEAEETLSLCDLPIYSDESNWDDYSKQDESASFDNEDSFFEFFSDDFSASNSSYFGSDNIIFCGKLIPYKQPSDSKNTAKIKPEKFSGENCQFRAKSRSFDGGKPAAVDAEGLEFASARPRGVKKSSSFSIPVPKNSEYVKRKRGRNSDKYGLPRETILESSSMKSRWFLFLFGSARFPKEMELSNVRTRQRRNSQSIMFRPSDEREMLRGSSGKKKWNGLWKLVRALVMGCRSGDRNVAVKGSFGSMPLL